MKHHLSWFGFSSSDAALGNALPSQLELALAGGAGDGWDPAPGVES